MLCLRSASLASRSREQRAAHHRVRQRPQRASQRTSPMLEGGQAAVARALSRSPVVRGVSFSPFEECSDAVCWSGYWL